MLRPMIRFTLPAFLSGIREPFTNFGLSRKLCVRSRVVVSICANLKKLR
jgi:hypothetical protein